MSDVSFMSMILYFSFLGALFFIPWIFTSDKVQNKVQNIVKNNQFVDLKEGFQEVEVEKDVSEEEKVIEEEEEEERDEVEEVTEEREAVVEDEVVKGEEVSEDVEEL